MKKTLKIALILILLIIYIYVLDLSTIPSNIIIVEGEKINLKTIIGLTTEGIEDYDSIRTSSNIGNQKTNKNSTININLFGKINLKTVNVSIIPTTTIIPLGNAVGMKLYTKGVMVVGMTEIETDNNKKEKPFENSGIEEGDSIISINNKEVSTTDELIEEVNKSNGKKINIEYLKNDNTLYTSIVPVKSNNRYKIGLWVRDAAAGVGTLTFYEPSNNTFMSLGHGIVDVDTGEIVEISNGELVTANIISIIKGQKDSPGEIRGTITNGNMIGKIYKNTDFGVYGKLYNFQYLTSQKSEIQVATRDEIQEGKATIYCQLDNDGPKEYEIEIKKIYMDDDKDNKSMLIKITDETLIEKTGGIIQGMSGAPIIQNGKFIGAVTNVLVKDPKEGYAIFGDILIKQMKEID